MGNSWEPDYGDSIFLEKLENFHRAFAERYAGKDYVRYVDVGSYGDWGEGHTASSSKRDWEWSTIKAHFDIYAKYYKDTQIVISDDFIGSRSVQEGKTEIYDYVLNHGWTYRDDSILVDWFVKSIGGDTVRSPELFNAVWQTVPVVLELEHYSKTVTANNWNGGNKFMLAALNTHSTYAGFHGYPADWVRENPELAVSMGNRLGYWYFINTVKLTQDSVIIELQNKGMSRAYNKYELDLIFTDEQGNDTVFSLDDFDNTELMPNEKITTEHKVDIKLLSSGKYSVSIRMHKGERPVYFAVSKSRTGSDGRCLLGNLTI